MISSFGFRHRSLALLCLVLGCGDSASPDRSGGSDVSVAADDGTCTLDNGTYVFSYPQLSGTCGPLPDEVLVVQNGGGFSAGMSSEVDCDETVSCDQGSLAVQARCTATLSGTQVEIRRLLTFNVGTMTGALDFRVLAAATAESCASTYRVVGTSQQDSNGAAGMGASPELDAGTSAGAGTLGNGAECLRDSECVSGDCSESAGGQLFCYGTIELGGRCVITQDCANGVCIADACTDPDELFPNGTVCTDSTQCASLNCGTSVGGDRFCYGNASNGESCAITQDCATGICRSGVCTDPGSCTMDTECVINAICNDANVCEVVCGSNAVATGDSCVCLPGFEWASADPSDTNCARPAVLPGCHIIAQDSSETYLGEVGDCYASNSVCNSYGSYGSEYASDSIFNPYGTFGSEYSTYSAFNSYTQSPPLLVCNGEISGCVTSNAFACAGQDNVSPTLLCNCP